MFAPFAIINSKSSLAIRSNQIARDSNVYYVLLLNTFHLNASLSNNDLKQGKKRNSKQKIKNRTKFFIGSVKTTVFVEDTKLTDRSEWEKCFDYMIFLIASQFPALFLISHCSQQHVLHCIYRDVDTISEYACCYVFLPNDFQQITLCRSWQSLFVLHALSCVLSYLACGEHFWDVKLFVILLLMLLNVYLTALYSWLNTYWNMRTVYE